MINFDLISIESKSNSQYKKCNKNMNIFNYSQDLINIERKKSKKDINQINDESKGEKNRKKIKQQLKI